MKKDLIFTPVMLAVGIALFLLRFTGMPVHIAISVIGLLVLAVSTAATKKASTKRTAPAATGQTTNANSARKQQICSHPL